MLSPFGRIRLATVADAAAVAAIYAPFCESTVVSFEYRAPSPEEMARRILAITVQHPWLVLTDDEVVAGYAYAGPHRERAAYAWSVDTAVYVAPGHRRRGVGTALYSRLFHILRLQGYFNAYAGVTLPNEPSIRLHESVGFTAVGVYRRVGYKLGAWHDVAWFELALQPRRREPTPPLALSELPDSALLPRHPT
jgi:phosphinothricin acetyltransferase